MMFVVTYDVIVIGLGGMGSAAAYHLARRGRRVLGLEKFGPAHALGSSHGGSRITRQAYFEDPAYVPLVQRAQAMWPELERETGSTILSLTGGLMIGAPDCRLVTGSLASAEHWDLPHELLDARELRRRFPELQPHHDEVALFEEAAGFVRPEESVRAHLAGAERRGAELHFDEPVCGWRSLGGGAVRASTPRGTYEAGHLVIAPGAWAPALLAGLELPLTVERLVQFWFRPRGGTRAFEQQPIFIWEPEDGKRFYSFPAHGDVPGAVKAAMFRSSDFCTADTVARAVGPDEVEELRSYLRERVPALDVAPIDARACMYTNTPDEDFVIAAHPEHADVTIASGFSGHGFKFVPVVGEILADLATEGATSHPIDLFDPARLGAATRGQASAVALELGAAPQQAHDV